MGASKQRRGGRRRAREKHADEIDSLFDALTISEMRSALTELGGPPTGAKLSDRDSVEKAILDSGRSVAEILATLRRAEVSSPKKHFFLAIASGNLAKAVKNATRDIGKKLAGDVVLSYQADLHGVVCFLLERVTHGYAWDILEPRAGYTEVLGKRQTRVRHAIVVRVETANGRAMLNYHGLPTGIDYDYAAAIQGALEAVAKLGLHLEPLPVGKCVAAVIAAKGRRVIPVRGDLVTQDGELKMRSRVGKASIQQLVARLVEGKSGEEGGELNEAQIMDRITENMGRHMFETIGLLWADERVLTRVDFLDGGADLLFVWGDTEASFTVAGRMLNMLFELAAGLTSDTFNSIWSAIVDLQDDAHLSPAHFRSSCAAPAQDVDAVLVEAVKLGLLLPVYQLKADDRILDELGRFDWTPDLSSLRREFTSGDVSIDGTMPENIRVAFRRVRARMAQR